MDFENYVELGVNLCLLKSQSLHCWALGKNLEKIGPISLSSTQIHQLSYNLLTLFQIFFIV